MNTKDKRQIRAWRIACRRRFTVGIEPKNKWPESRLSEFLNTPLGKNLLAAFTVPADQRTLRQDAILKMASR